MIRAILFDLDGVLFDGAPIHFQALNLALAENDCRPIGLEEHKTIFDGLPTREKLRRLVEAKRVPVDRVTKISSDKQQKTMMLMKNLVKFDPTVFCTIVGVKARGISWGIVTNAVHETAIYAIRLLGLPFPDVLVANEEAEPKPSPAPYKLASFRLDTHPEEILVVEDGKYGIESATAAGCRVMVVTGPSDVTPGRIFSHL